MKKILSRIVGGFVIGVVIGQIVQVTISFKLGHGEYIPVLDHFSSYFNKEIVAVILQILLTGIIGVAFAISSLIFDIAKWSLLKQYIVHFCITALVWVPIVMLIWTPRTTLSTMIFLINFLGTYVITWVIQYVISKKDIKQINAAIQLKQLEKEGND
ncbi:DUF3021 domain-containing protein [Bacillus sp. SCS-151]|uniref:DUF3021 domain-containing protein n=1 Tax=Nanhaiella sioensis TaxID=3115293 RepID=UPI00397E2889